MKPELIRFVDSRIGKPYVVNGRGPDEYDCFGLVMEFYRSFLGVEIEDDTEEVPFGWQQDESYEDYKKRMLNQHCVWLEQPEEFCIVLISTDRSNRIDHIGIYLGEDRFLHTSEKGVRTDRLSKFTEANLIRGHMRVAR